MLYSRFSSVIYFIHDSMHTHTHTLGFPGGSDNEVSTCSAGDPGFLGREESPGEGTDYPLQYSCLKNPMDRRRWWATVYGVEKS